VTALSRVLPEDDSRLQAARTAAATAGRAVTAARQAESASIADLAATLAAWLTEDPAQDVARLESQYPIVLLPARIETRFVPEQGQLLVRVYPDAISADAHEPELSVTERAAGQAYWAAASAGQESLTAWQALLATYSPPRAAWIVRVTAPGAGNPQSELTKPSSHSRSASARTLSAPTGCR
jgi:hypothetical protein